MSRIRENEGDNSTYRMKEKEEMKKRNYDVRNRRKKREISKIRNAKKDANYFNNFGTINDLLFQIRSVRPSFFYFLLR